MQQSEKKKMLLIFKEYLEKKYLYYETVPRTKKYFQEILPGGKVVKNY